MKKLIITFISVFALMSFSPLVTAEEAGFWDKTTKGVSSAADWTKEKSKKGWEDSEEDREEAAKWVKKNSKKGWQATRDLGDKLFD